MNTINARPMKSRVCIDTILRCRWVYGPRTHALAEKPPGPVPRQSDAPPALMASRNIGPLLIRVANRLADWQDRQAGRRLLMTLDDRALKDAGIDRAAADEEYRKPFWR